MRFLTAAILSSVAALPASAQTTRFVRDPARFEAKQAQVVAAARAQSPQMAAELEKAFATDIIAQIAPELRRLGLSADDMADMTAAYWVAAWEAAHGIVGKPSDPAQVRGARTQIAGVMATNPALARMSDADKQDVADTMLLQTLLVDARMRAAAGAGAAMQKKMGDAIAAEAAQTLKVDLTRVTLTDKGFSGTGAPAPAGAGPSAAVPAAHGDNWSRVEGVYFKSYTGVGVGGMVTIEYEPVVFFKDGSYYEVEGPALEDVDLAARRAAKPAAWGTWKRAGAGYVLTDHKGRASDEKLQDGSFFKAFAAEDGGGTLRRAYKRVSGGGNAALGGEMSIMTQTRFAFAPDGSFAREGSAGAIGSGAQSGVSMAAGSRRGGGGRYTVKRHTITMTGADGRTERQFFAFGSQGNVPRVDDDMIFIGDRAFVDMDD